MAERFLRFGDSIVGSVRSHLNGHPFRIIMEQGLKICGNGWGPGGVDSHSTTQAQHSSRAYWELNLVIVANLDNDCDSHATVS